MVKMGFGFTNGDVFRKDPSSRTSSRHCFLVDLIQKLDSASQTLFCCLLSFLDIQNYKKHFLFQLIVTCLFLNHQHIRNRIYILVCSYMSFPFASELLLIPSFSSSF